ncbi:uncharacterized protein LOC114524172 [Dendronephthya gigantea]|uniref:uncharacterized protein LOC114524172 n=1 Tax=Dendronephthya gigantea TaxID=151771 RepID=UPI001069CEF1|nr:uncharacterized protein LOC114524172 [Dendronephthya gigantea]
MVPAANPFPIHKPLTKFAIGTLTSMLLEKILYLDKGDNAQCALSIHNKLTRFRLINPYLFIMHGVNPLPLPLKINTNKSEETVMEAASRTGATSGLIFYEIDYVGQYMMIFWKIQGAQVAKVYTPNRFHVEITSTVKFDDQLWLEATYARIKEMSDKMQGPNEHFESGIEVPSIPSRTATPKFKITLQAQMTMGKKAEFMIELKDDLPPHTSNVYKRDVIGAIALGIISVGLNLAMKKVQSVIPSEQSCTIALENLSREETLIKPAWYIRAGETANIVPWEIKSDEVGEISFVIPLGGARLTQKFQHTVYFLSYHINGTDYSIVIGTWFPLKLQPEDNWEDILQKKNPRYTVFLMKTPTANMAMKNVLKVVGDLFVQYKDAKELSKQLMKTNQNIHKLIAQSNLQNPKIPTVQTNKLQKYLEWHYPLIKTSTVAGKQTNEEYHIRIVSAMGIGKATGMVIKVEVAKGKSPASFALVNPQSYKEPPETTTQDVETQFPSPATNVGPPKFPSTNAGLAKFPTDKSNADLLTFPLHKKYVGHSLSTAQKGLLLEKAFATPGLNSQKVYAAWTPIVLD